jgi:hypothetical protein
MALRTSMAKSLSAQSVSARSVLARAVVCFGLTALTVFPAAAETRLKQIDGQWRLVVDGKPFVVKGVGGAGPKDMAASHGANSFRTWGADDIGAELDEAQRLGMKVAVGIWLVHERHGFSYGDQEVVAAEIEKARVAIEKYKNHPAVLLWAIGNEMEGEHANNPAIWLTINQIAAMAKKLDPTRPTMTVLAELGGDRIKNFNRFCPDIDILGINTYAGATSIPKRYVEGGGTRPYLITEFGPPGTWEVAKDSFGTVPEPTSTAKGASYRAAHVANMASPLCLGTYAFTWGQKQEATSTWFGMFLPDGTRLEATDVMHELWSGKPPENRVPVISEVEMVPPDAPRSVPAGGTITARVAVSDPEKDPVTIKWELHREAERYLTGGDPEAATPNFPEAIVSTSGDTVTVKMPQDGGLYRLYAMASDAHGGAATANVTLRAEGPKAARTGTAVKLPVDVYADGLAQPTWVASGWMGNIPAIKFTDKSTDSPHTGPTCIRVDYTANDNFGGIAWQSPANDWGDQPGGRDLTGATKLTFYARGANGGERVEFKYGILGKEKPYFDTGSGAINVTLTNQWKQYSIPLGDQDLTRIKTGFVWALQGQGKPVTFYLDDIRFE